MPRSKGSAWLYGCGIGCAVVGLGLVALVGAGVVFFRNLAGGFEQAEEARLRLEKAHGDPSAFTPWPDGALPADRIQRFLAVRDAMAPHRAVLAQHFDKLPMTREKVDEIKQARGFDRFAKGLFLGREAISMVQDIGRYTGQRDEALLASDMGMGEYMYLYCLIYYAWLGHAPTDGPGDARERGEQGGMHFASMKTLWRLHDDMLEMLQREQAALPAGSSSAWAEALAGEIAAMRKDEERMPWQGGLPAQTAASLEPFRERLAPSYDAAVNSFELMRISRRGRFSYQAD